MNDINLTDFRKIPNLISLFRLIFIPLIFILFKNINDNRWNIILVVIVFSLLDNLDGFIARKLNQITELGKIIDPLADKLFIISFAINLLSYSLIPPWFIYIVIVRDILIMLAGVVFIKKINKVPSSDFIGKMTVGAIGVIFLMSIMNFQKIDLIFNLSLKISALLILISLLNYGYKQIKNLR